VGSSRPLNKKQRRFWNRFKTQTEEASPRVKKAGNAVDKIIAYVKWLLNED